MGGQWSGRARAISRYAAGLFGFAFLLLAYAITNHDVGHGNAYVRSSVAAAVAEGVEHWPQTIQKTVLVLQSYFREKVLHFLH